MSRWQQPAQDADEPFARVSVNEAKRLIEEGDVDIVDVREPSEYRDGHVPGARLVPLGTLLRDPQQHLTRDNVLFICSVGERSAVACEVGASIGLQRVYNLEGGTTAWQSAGNPIER